jgi:hypothetical protein
MDDSLDKASATAILEALGYSVATVPTGHQESPDLRATKDSESLLIEVKRKHDDTTEIEKREQAYCTDDVYVYSMPLGRQSTISRQAEKACRQLKNVASLGDYCLIWFVSSGMHIGAQCHRIRATLYGIQYVIDRIRGAPMAVECFYFQNSDFYNGRDVLSGAILQDDDGVSLLVNDLHERAREFRGSHLYGSFRKWKAVCDPIDFESQGLVYVVDGPVDRRNSAKVLGYLSRKYGLKDPMAEMPSEHGAEVRFPDWP